MVVQDFPEKRKGVKILLIGKDSMVAKEFIERYASGFQLILVGKEDNLTELIAQHAPFYSTVFLAQSGGYKSKQFTLDLVEVNINLLFRALNAVSGKTTQFIYFSTGSVYANSDAGIYTEQSALDVSSESPYIASKIAGELILKTYRSAIPGICILRPFYIYGKGQKETMLFKAMLNKVINGKEIELKGTNGMMFNPVYASDVADLLYHLIQNAEGGMRMMNVAGNQVTNLREVVEIIAECTGKEVIIKHSEEPSPIAIGKTSIKGWEPIVQLQEGVSKICLNA